MTLEGYTFETASQFIGQKLGVSDWVDVSQERINQFADCTGDHQWIHVDPERAKVASPLGTTIAHGFLTLSLLPMMTGGMGLVPAGTLMALNYGTDKVRFISPVKSGSRVRVHVELADVTPKSGGRLLIKTLNTIEIEGEEKPAMVAEALTMVIPAP